MIAGAIIFMAGLILWGGGKHLHWLGHLPGDIRIERDNFKFYMPITTMILVSIVLSLVIWLVRKLGG